MDGIFPPSILGIWILRVHHLGSGFKYLFMFTPSWGRFQFYEHIFSLRLKRPKQFNYLICFMDKIQLVFFQEDLLLDQIRYQPDHLPTIGTGVPAETCGFTTGKWVQGDGIWDVLSNQDSCGLMKGCVPWRLKQFLLQINGSWHRKQGQHMWIWIFHTHKKLTENHPKLQGDSSSKPLFFRGPCWFLGSIQHLNGKSCFFLQQKKVWRPACHIFKSNLRHVPCHQLSILQMLRNPGIMACFESICLYHPSDFLKYMCNKVENYLGTVGCYACRWLWYLSACLFVFCTFHW